MANACSRRASRLLLVPALFAILGSAPFVTFASGPASAAPTVVPNSFTHTRVILLGCDTKSFYTLRYETTRPGSWYEATTRIHLDKQSLDGKLIQSRLVRETHDVDADGNGKWKSEDQAVNYGLLDVVLESGMRFPMPMGLSEVGPVAVDSTGLFLDWGSRRTTLLQPAEMDQQVPGFLELAYGEDVGIENVFSGPGTVYVVIQLGSFCCDRSAVQKVIAIPAEKYRSARHEFDKEDMSGARTGER